MKALVKTEKGPGHVEVRDVPEPKLTRDDWVKIRVKAAGICGTDLHIWHDQFPQHKGLSVSVNVSAKQFAESLETPFVRWSWQ